jgi:hypothetical protein
MNRTEELYTELQRNALIFSLMPRINSMALCLPSKADFSDEAKQFPTFVETESSVLFDETNGPSFCMSDGKVQRIDGK